MSESTLPSWAPRQAAVVLAMLETTEEGVREGQPADRIINNLIAGNKKYGSRDRRLIRDTIFSWFRWHGAVGDLPLARGVCAAWALENREWPPALLAMLEELDWTAPPPAQAHEPFADRKAKIESAFGIELSPVEEWLPRWWKEQTDHLGNYQDRLAEHFQRPPTWLRVDQNARANLHPQLIEDGAEWAGEASPESYAFEDAGKVSRWLQTQKEHLEIQDLSSQQVVRICNPQAGQKWWDACCGNGGKSLQLLDQAERNLDLTCTDRREEVLSELTRRGRRHGLSKVRRYALDLLKSDIQLPNVSFDGILVDAPCSGTGTWSRNPDAPWRTEASDVNQGHRRQVKMLQTVGPALNTGGTLIYAVCSLCKTETIEVVSEFLESTPDYELSPFENPLTGETTDGTLSFLPNQTRADGMFVAKFVKK
ncbi:RsmB/NOP family class I SAM-dependent RNA methyltransferase [Kiritimatiellaeota bacterium B1221]|nr:RsmB/NOP family class I SAM-dependent RNA methyltransferase [Kiritimatiellaeota bacterium B1221]